jgi:hypothetical protein
MPAPFPTEARDRARELYMEDKRAGQIARVIAQEFDRACKAATINSWIKKEGWLDIRSAKNSLALISATERQMSETRKDAEVHAAVFGSIWKDAQRKIQDMGGNLPDIEGVEDFERYSRIVEKMILGERKVKAGIFSFQFVDDIVSVLKTEITDEDIIGRISSKLRVVAEKYRSENKW